MKIKSLLLVTGLLFVAATFHSCSSTSSVAKRITVRSGEIPPDMAKEDFVLLGTLKKGSEDYMKNNFSNYTGNYKLGTPEELQITYNDKAKYRYVMDYTSETSTGRINGTNMSSTGFRYYILDRKSNIKYRRNERSSFKNLEIRAYLKAIEAVRKKGYTVNKK